MKKLYFMLLALLLSSLPSLTASADVVDVASFKDITLSDGGPIYGTTSNYTLQLASSPEITLEFARGATYADATGMFSLGGGANYKSVTISLANGEKFSQIEFYGFSNSSTSNASVGLVAGQPGTLDKTTGIWTSDEPVESVTFRGGSSASSYFRFTGIKITYGGGGTPTPKLHAYYTNSTSNYTSFAPYGVKDYNEYTQTILVKGENLVNDVTLTSDNSVLSVSPSILTAEQAMAGTDVTMTFTPNAKSDVAKLTIATKDEEGKDVEVEVNASAANADIYNATFTGTALAINSSAPATLALNLENAKQFISYQTDITLPAGLTIAEDGITTNSAAHQVSYNKLGDAYRVIVFSANNAAFDSNEGVLNLNIVADDTFNGGNITLDKTVMTFGNKKAYEPAAATIETKVLVKISGVKITSDTPNNTVENGKDIKLTATIEPAEAADQVKTIEWSSDNEDVAVVYQGTVSSKKPGTANITVTVTALDGTVVTDQVTVTVVGIESVTIAPETATLYKGGETVKLEATVKVTPADAEITLPAVRWISLQPAIATVDDNGVVTPVGVGTATIQAQVEDVYGYATITVHAAESITIGAADDQDVVNVGETLTLSASAKPNNVEVNWTSSNTEIATVDENGVVTGVKAGTVKITATAKDDAEVSAEITLTIAGIESVEVTPATASLSKGGKTLQLEANVTVFPEGAEGFDTTVEWTSSNEEVATVDENGVVTPVGEGEVTITATSKADANIKGEAKINVGLTTEITIELGDGNDNVLTIGEELQLNVTTEPEGAAAVVWSSSDDEVATVDENGKVTAKKPGEVTITATAGDGSGVTGTITLTVAGVTAIEVTAEKNTVNMGSTLDLTATVTVYPEDADVVKNVTWSTSDAAVATVDENGKVTPVAKGTVTITATSTDGTEVKGSIELTVTNYMQTLTIDSEMEIEVEKEAELNVVYTPVDADEAELVWTSSNEEVAVVENGTLKAKAVGTAVITVSNVASGLSASMNVTVTEKAVLLGDANGDGKVLMNDVTSEVEFILEKNPDPFFFTNADVNADEKVNVVDVSLTVDIILNDASSANEMMAYAAQQNVKGLTVEDVNIKQNNKMTIALGNISGISALQADLTMPEGVKVKNITLANGMKNHMVAFKNNGDRVRVAMYSLSLAEVEEGTAMLEVELESEISFEDKYAQISNIFAATVDSELINFESVSVKMSNTSAIEAIYADLAGNNVYTTQGILVKRNATFEDIKALTPGLYIIGGKKVMVK